QEVKQFCYVYHATEHEQPKQLMKLRQPERIEQEYIRHGTTTLIVSRNVATGQMTSYLSQTRTENDLVCHLLHVVSQDPKSHYVFVMDQLNTHKSESLVLFVAEQCGIPQSSLG